MKRTSIKDDSEFKKPALRLSLIVYGRESVGTKVRYLIDPKGQGDKKGNPRKHCFNSLAEEDLQGVYV
jgi:hypothetical protein